jgi:hypothetical protein
MDSAAKWLQKPVESFYDAGVKRVEKEFLFDVAESSGWPS